MKRQRKIEFIEREISVRGNIKISSIIDVSPVIYSKIGETHYDKIDSINLRSCTISSFIRGNEIDKCEYGYADLDDEVLDKIIEIVKKS